MINAQKGHADYSFLIYLLGGGAFVLGVGLVAAGIWLLWKATGLLGWW